VHRHDTQKPSINVVNSQFTLPHVPVQAHAQQRECARYLGALSFLRSVEASWAVGAEPTFFALSVLIVAPQYGQVRVFVSALASKSPPHLLQASMSVSVIWFAYRKPFPRGAR
jgi:hypothetical protein